MTDDPRAVLWRNPDGSTREVVALRDGRLEFTSLDERDLKYVKMLDPATLLLVLANEVGRLRDRVSELERKLEESDLDDVRYRLTQVEDQAYGRRD